MSGLMISGNYTQSTTSPLANQTFLTAAIAETFKKKFLTISGQKKTDMQIEKQIAWEGAGSAPVKTEAQAPENRKITESYQDTIIQKIYGLEWNLTMEQRMFSIKNAQFLQTVSKMRARSIALTYEYTTAAKYSNGFASDTTGDAVYAWSASHVWKSDASTFSNLLTASVFDKEALQDALIQTVNAEMEYDVKAEVMPQEIRYGTDYVMTVKEVLKSVKDPDSANNTYNPVTDWNLKANMNPYFNVNDWFLSCAESKSEEFVTLSESMSPTFGEDKQASGAQNTVMTSLCGFGVGYTHSNAIKMYGNAGS